MKKNSKSQPENSVAIQNARKASIKHILSELYICYDIIFDDLEDMSTPRNWVINNFPFFWWGKIDVKNVKNSQTFESCGRKYSYTELLKNFMHDNASKTVFVYLVWFDDWRPILRLKSTDVIEYLYEILEDDEDVWIVCPEKGWCVEYHHIGELSFLLLEKKDPS